MPKTNGRSCAKIVEYQGSICGIVEWHRSVQSELTSYYGID